MSIDNAGIPRLKFHRDGFWRWYPRYFLQLAKVCPPGGEHVGSIVNGESILGSGIRYQPEELIHKVFWGTGSISSGIKPGLEDLMRCKSGECRVDHAGVEVDRLVQ